MLVRPEQVYGSLTADASQGQSTLGSHRAQLQPSESTEPWAGEGGREGQTGDKSSTVLLAHLRLSKAPQSPSTATPAPARAESA